MFSSLLEDESEMRQFLAYQALGVSLALVLVFYGNLLNISDVLYSGIVLGVLHVLLFFNVKPILSIHSGLSWFLVFRLGFTLLDGVIDGNDSLIVIPLVVLLLVLTLSSLNGKICAFSCRS